MADERNFRLLDRPQGIDALFTTSEKMPGMVKVSVLNEFGEYVVPTPQQLQKILKHPHSDPVRINMILAAGKDWSSWQDYAEKVLIHMALKGGMVGDA